MQPLEIENVVRSPVPGPARIGALERLVIRCALAEAARVGAVPRVRGLSPASFAVMCACCLPGEAVENGAAPAPFDEFEELLELLLDHLAPFDQGGIWLAAVIASAAQRGNHLWQDLGLPSRRELSDVLRLRFARLAARNGGDMKWKKFFYRELCQRAGVPICKSPSCGDCVDHGDCFGAEH
ncbi:MAG: nitrogen fixation protein NifQ [Candidatus Dactylopiibacterium sp.]|nr:nitrogen fixation protein NifQ [Candidatus Dactylopiibacterium sp.]